MDLEKALAEMRENITKEFERLKAEESAVRKLDIEYPALKKEQLYKEDDSAYVLLKKIGLEFMAIGDSLRKIFDIISPLSERMLLRPMAESKEITPIQMRSVKEECEFIQNRLTLLNSLIKQLDYMEKEKLAYNIEQINNLIESTKADNVAVNLYVKGESWFFKTQPEGTVFRETQASYIKWAKAMLEFFKRTDSLRESYPEIKQAPKVADLLNSQSSNPSP